MTSILSLRPETEGAVIAEAHRQGVSPQDLLETILVRGLPAPRPEVDVTLTELASRPAPRSLDDLRPRLAPPPGSNGIEYVIGHWPGDESDEALAAALEEVE